MTIDHDTFDERVDHLDQLDTLPGELAAHSDTCARCERRLDLARQIRSTARQLVADHTRTVGLADAVLATTHPPRRSLLVLAAVAAAVVVAVGAGVVITNRSDDQRDVLAEIAEQYRTSSGTRFVYATEATIDIADHYDLDTTTTDAINPLGTALPTCPDEPATVTESPTTLDLAPIANALAADDPCLALALIDDSVAQPAIDTYTALAASINHANDELAAIDSTRATSPHVATSAAAYRQRREADIAAADTALDELARSFNSLSTTLEPIADHPTVEPGASIIVEDRVVALKADTDRAESAIPTADTTVTWTQISTGTWTPDSIVIEGTTEGDSHIDAFTGVDEDPLGLAAVVFSTPDTLTAILDSAPPSTSDTIEWTVPDDIIAGTGTWTATAHIDNSKLVELTVASSDVILIFTPAR